MKAIADGHAAAAGEHVQSDLVVCTVGILVAPLTETSRGVEVAGEVVDGDHLIGGEGYLREEVKVIEEKAVTDAEEAITRSKTTPLTAEHARTIVDIDQKRLQRQENGCKMVEVELGTIFRRIPEETLPRR